MGRSVDGRLWCDGCGVQITWAPEIRQGQSVLEKSSYCCQDCADGLTCSCGERMEIEEDQRSVASGLVFSG